MRSLFVKIFLSFWLAMSLIGTAFAVIHVTSPPWAHQRKVTFITQALEAHGAEAVRLIQERGGGAAVALNQALEERSEVRVHLFRDGEAWRGAPPPSPAIQSVAHQVARQGQPLRRVSGPRELYGVPLQGERLEGWVIVGTLDSPRLLRYLEPQTLPLRVLVLFLISGLICYVLARYISRPIRALQRVTQKLGEGDLRARVGSRIGRRGDETGALGRDFDRMADRLQGLLDAQRRLLRDISHELRSPLARLNVALELARTKVGTAAGEELDRIEREAERLNELIGQLTTLTLLESGAEEIVPAPVDLEELVREVVRDTTFEGQARGRRVELTRSEAVTLPGSQELLRRAVENVVRNGLRFTAEGTAVEVSLAQVEVAGRAVAQLRVRDHGEGIPEEALEEVFRPFVRVADARDRARGGSGIGLAISERAVSLHGGTIRARNADGGGLLVAIDLPLDGRAPAAPPV